MLLVTSGKDKMKNVAYLLQCFGEIGINYKDYLESFSISLSFKGILLQWLSLSHGQNNQGYFSSLDLSKHFATGTVWSLDYFSCPNSVLSPR